MRTAECYEIGADYLLSIIGDYGLPDDPLPPQTVFFDADYAHTLPSYRGAAFLVRTSTFSFPGGGQIDFELVEAPVENKCVTRAFYRDDTSY